MLHMRSTRAGLILAFGLLIAACGSGAEQTSPAVTGDDSIVPDSLPFDESSGLGDADIDPVTGEILSEDVCDDAGCRTVFPEDEIAPDNTEPDLASEEDSSTPSAVTSILISAISTVDNDGALEAELESATGREPSIEVVACIRDEAISQGFEEVTEDQLFLAAIVCDSTLEEEARTNTRAIVELNALAVTSAQVDCLVEGTFDLLINIPLAEAPDFGDPDLSPGLLDHAVSCGLSDEDAVLLLNGA